MPEFTIHFPKWTPPVCLPQANFALSNLKTKDMATEKKTGAFLQITMNIKESDRAAAAAVYNKYRQPFLDGIHGATSKQLLVRENDVQVLHGFASVADAENYLKSDLFTQDVFVELKPYFQSDPDVRIYSVVG